MTASKTTRKASDSLNGTAVPAKEPAVPAGDENPETPLFGDAPATAAKSSETIPTAPDETDAEGEEYPEFEQVGVQVIIDQFNYIDDEGAHASAVQGDLLTLDAAAASRGFRIGALAPRN